MGTPVFDTLAMATKLRDEAGFDQKQAEALARAIASAMTAELVTQVRHDASVEELKSEIASVKQELKAEIAALRQEMHAEIGALRQEVHAEIGSLRQEMKADNAAMRQEFKREMAEMDARAEKRLADAMRWMIGVMVGLLGLTVALIKLLP